MSLNNDKVLIESRIKWIQFFNHLFLDSDEMWNLYSLTHRYIIAVNTRSVEVMGYTLEELRNTPVERIYPETELLKLGGIFEHLKTKFVTNDDLKVYTKSRELKNVTVRSSILSWEPEVLCLVKTIEI